MGQRQDLLNKICIDKFGRGHHVKPTNEDLMSSNYYKEIKEIYSKLNGQLNTPPTRFGSWDINLKEFIIELDEERHFNRYRLVTLNSDFYLNHNLFDKDSYKEFCITHESDCIKSASWGKNWKNNSTEKQFGTSSEPKDFSGNGSSRWKQRAYYDFVKDVASKVIDIPILRISIWENFESGSIDSLIKRNQRIDLEKFIELKIKKHVG